MHGRWVRALVCACGLLASIAGGVRGQSTARAVLVGTVFDSVGMRPLAGAVVRIVRADDPSIGRTTQRDSVGRFAYDTVMGGAGGFTIDEFVSLDKIAAVEVYARANLAPPEYATMDGGCGVVAIWTKLATGGVSIQPPKSDRR